MSKVNRKLRTLYCADFIELLILINNVCIFRKRVMVESKVENTKKESMETTKRGKLAKLAGFELEMKKDSLVLKDTNFSLWLNVARSKT